MRESPGNKSTIHSKSKPKGKGEGKGVNSKKTNKGMKHKKEVMMMVKKKKKKKSNIFKGTLQGNSRLSFQDAF
eukprot:scaffold4138_cov132-Amphora_coffeaeformis.AAC.1